MKRKLKRLQVLGLVDSEGMFFIGAYRRLDRKRLRYVYCVEFKVTQMYYSLELLYKLQEFFNCGRVVIDNKKTGGYKYVVTSKKDLWEKIIPFFDENVLLTSKYLDYKVFRKGVKMLIDEGEMTEKMYIDINILRENLNKRRDKREVLKDSEERSVIITKDWLVGFIEGDGSFQFSMGKECKASLEIAQSKWRRPLLKKIRDFFNSGAMKPKLDKELEESRDTHRLVLSGKKVIREKVLPMFKEMELFSIKGKDLKDWELLIEKWEKGEDKTVIGREEMLKIKKGMNKGRLERKNS